MANSYKDIVITPNKSSSVDDPKIVFSGANASVNTDITLRVYPDSNGSISFEGSAGQLFSITNDLTGSIFSVNDVSGIPSIDVDAMGNVDLAPYSGNVGIGTTSPTEKLHVVGNIKTTGYMDSDLAFRGQANDTASIPSFTWTGETNTGIYRPSTNVIGFSIGGSETARFDSSGLTIPKSGAVINLTNTTSGYINYAASGYAAPTVTTRSAGTKLVLYPGISSTAVDWAIGIESATMWFSASASSSGFKWYANTSNFMSATTTLLSHSSSVRSPIFYDSDNTAYFIDGAATSQLNAVNFSGDIRTWRSAANTTGVIYFGQTGSYYLYWDGGSYNLNGGYVYNTGSFRAPIFYDSNNTSYYVDPTSATSAVLAGTVTLTTVPNYRNTTTIASNYTVANTHNEMSIGPITINNGVTVTVDNGASWVIV